MSDGNDPIEKARALGLEVVFPNENELFVDIDSNESWDEFLDAIPLLSQMERAPGLLRFTVTASRNGNKHVVVTLGRPVKDQEERLMLQAMLGSDRKRELLGLRQVRSGDRILAQRAVCFFNKKESGGDDTF